ncbi:MAG: hypothetical protein U1F61_23445 [Opitutaceae bacterium]
MKSPFLRIGCTVLVGLSAQAVATPVRSQIQSDPTLSPGDELQEGQRAMAKGRAQYLAGDWDAAEATLRSLPPAKRDDPLAKDLLRRIAEDRARVSEGNRNVTRAQMVDEVGRSWERPAVFEDRPPADSARESVSRPLVQKLNSIQIPAVSFNQMDLNRVAQTLSAIAEECDPSTTGPRGVNVVLIDPANRNPEVTLSLRNLSLKRILDFVTDSVGFQYEVQEDAVVLKPGGETSSLDTAFFPVARSTVIRMTGFAGSAPPAPATPDPSASSAEPGSSHPTPLSAGGGEANLLRTFLQSAGVVFDGTPGASLAYDGSAMIVTQTPRNIERIRAILNRYTDVRQVEIEAKFMEVQEGVLDEMGITWGVGRTGRPRTDPATGQPLLDRSGRPLYTSQANYSTDRVNRTLSGAFTGSTNGNSIVIDGESVASTAPPRLPGAVALAGEASGLASISGIIGDFNVSAMVRLLAQKSGSDLLSAPRVTVLSGNTATITVAQELRYPQSYGEIQSQVGSGRTAADGSGGGSAGVTITAGTPQDFTSRNVGVELKVTPTVEEDDYSISLDLSPKVTEFEGFVEFGGPSVAVSGGRTVTVPPGFYQPIFSVREVSTRVTLWDGATLIMGGLTREEVKKVHDKIPVLGDLPLFGRAFRSKGQSSQKRNLLIFVTANLVSPGGSPKKQALPTVQSGSSFQNPTLVTPARAESRPRVKP